MKKQIIAAILATCAYSSNVKAELSDSHYVYLEAMAEIVYNKVECVPNEADLARELNKFRNNKFKKTFIAQIRALGVNIKEDQSTAFNFFKEIIGYFEDDCLSGNPDEEDPDQDE